MKLLAKILIAVVVPAVGLGAAYKTGMLDKMLQHGQDSPHSSAFSKSGNEIVSSDKLMAQIGSATGHTLPAEDQLLGVIDQKPKTCSPIGAIQAEPLKPGLSETIGSDGRKETVSVKTRAPDEKGAPPEPNAGSEKKAAEKPPDSQEGPLAPAPDHKAQELKPNTDSERKLVETTPKIDAGQSKPERFELPGSLVVNIHGYSGAVNKWALMVLLDNSGSMVRRIKSWHSSRLKTAESLISKMPSALTSGSKIAVRDFPCKSGVKAEACRSRLLIGWTDKSGQLSVDKLSRVLPGGHINLCAAASESLKSDFSGVGGLTPRIIMLTDGAGKCKYGDLLKALDQRQGKDEVIIDLVRIGPSKKNINAYTTLVKKTGGSVYSLEKPADLDSLVAKFENNFKDRKMEKVEIRGENLHLRISPDKEITVPPGVYDIILPVVAGLQPAHRVIPKLKIESGEAKILDIKVAKGRPVVLKAAKK
jgi:hypothetical protein